MSHKHRGNYKRQMIVERTEASKQNSQVDPDFVLCLNHSCPFPHSRRYKPSPESNLQHFQCINWVLKSSSPSCEIKQKGDFEYDFLQYPIKSAIHAHNSSMEFNWLQYLDAIYLRIKEQFEASLFKSYERSRMTLQALLQISFNIYHLAKDFVKFPPQEFLHINEESFKSRLFQLQSHGKIQIFNQNLLSECEKQISILCSKLQRFVLASEQPESLDYRRKSMRKTQQAQNCLYNQAKPINIRLQMICNCFPKTLIAFQPDESLICWVCSENIKVDGKSKQDRRNGCQQKLYKHLLTIHQEMIEQIFTFKNFRLGIERLTMEQFKREAYLWPSKQFKVIDRENIGTDFREDRWYCVQILTRYTENLAKGRYLVAESKGKDAADILIILTLYELRSIPKARVILITNDHYGKTLIPIFENLGLNIKMGT